MRTMIEEYGTVIVSCVMGTVVISIGSGLFSTLSPMIEIYLLTLM
ncbi:MAG: hypothetical protein R3Y40_04100 [Eubacteriales bacterium]